MLSYKDGADELRIYLDAKTSLPTQTDILDDDPLEGDTSYLLRYGDWRKVDAVMTPFGLRYEINGRPFQEERRLHASDPRRGGRREKVIQPMEKDGFIEVD